MNENEKTQNEAEESELNKPISYKFLLSFTLPTIISCIIMASFGMIDGVFASRGVGVEALSAVKFVAPFLSFSMAIGFMLSMGGCALVSKKTGANLNQEARENFTLLTLITFMVSVLISTFGWVFITPLLELLGTDSYVFDMAIEYIQPLVLMMPLVMLGLFLTQFLIAEGKPILGMVASVSGAIISTALNALFIFVLELGVMGLALATGLGYTVSALLGLIYFAFNRKGTIYFIRPKWDIVAIWRSSINGVSEMITILASSVTTAIMNNVLVGIVGFEGVASAGIVMAIQVVFLYLYIGYATGIAPVVSYNYGKVEKERLSQLYKKSIVIMIGLSVIAFSVATIFAGLLVQIYVSADTEIYTMTVRGLRIVAISFLLLGFNTFATNWFTAFNDGLVSGFLSFMQTLLFTAVLLLTLPRIWDLTGVWVALPLAEALTIILTIFFLIKMGKKYGYSSVRAS